MSSVRGCDDCGIVFFENAEGWGTGSVSKMVKDERGKVTPQQIVVDYCPECVTRREMGTAASGQTRHLVTETERLRKSIDGHLDKE